MSNDDPGFDNANLRLVYRFLDHDLVENALFLLDRLHAQDHNNTCWIHLRSLCCLRLARCAAAYEYSHDEAVHGEHVGCAYIFAQACLRLKLYRDGISVLKRVLHSVVGEPPMDRFIPDAAAVHGLLGKLHRANGDVRKAAEAYAQALRADAFMWDAFTDLCDSGVALHLSNIFQPQSSSTKLPGETTIVSMPVDSVSSAGDEADETMGDPEDIIASSSVSPRRAQVPAKRKEGTTVGAFPLEQLTVQSNDPRSTSSLMPERRSARLKPYPPPKHLSSSSRGRRPSRAILEPKSRQPLHKSQPSSRTTKATQVTKTEKGKSVVTCLMSPSGPFSMHEDDLKPLYDLFLTLGTAYYHLKRFEPRACLDALATLPAAQQATPWVLGKTARAHYERMAYADARSSFEALRAACPSWTEDLEVCAAVLWHLKDDVQLSYQAHGLVETHYLAPQAWCAVGCAFSLAKRREEALAGFLRATQLQPPLAHAYSLLGHEYHDCEEYAEANLAFRRALGIDARHYIAWVGLGRVQERLGAPQRALHYYLIAQKVNPDNAVVLTNIARVCDELGTPELGLKFLRRVAAQAHASKRLAVFTKVQTAKLLLRMEEPDDAADELNAALAMAPDDAEIHLLLGKAVIDAGGSDLNEVLPRFTMALSLRPHSKAIKEALAALGSPRNTRKITPWNT